MKTLDKIRRHHPGHSLPQKLAFTFLIVLLGFGMGVLAKFLDGVAVNDMPSWLRPLDLGNFFSLVAPWAFAGLLISLFSRTPIRAAINAFGFYCGMLIGYYLYCGVFAHFLPDLSYLSIWLLLTLISPLLAMIFWYGRGRGTVAGFIAAVAIAYFFLQAFRFTPTFEGFAPYWNYSFLPLLLLAGAIGALWTKPLQILFSTLGGFALAYIYVLLPFSVPLV